MAQFALSSYGFAAETSTLESKELKTLFKAGDGDATMIYVASELTLALRMLTGNPKMEVQWVNVPNKDTNPDVDKGFFRLIHPFDYTPCDSQQALSPTKN